MSERDDISRWRANLQGETDAIAIYAVMAASESSPDLAEVYRRLGETEVRHAALWEAKLRERGAWKPVRPSFRARFLIALSRRFGPGVIAPTIAGREAADQTGYDAQPEAAGTSLPRDERSHARILKAITGGGVSGADLARVEGRHRTGGNALRAAVLGINDGLVSNFSLVMGVAGAGGGVAAIAIAGLAGLIAGSLSMALGEWLSVQSARELFTRQIEIESEELTAAPEEEEIELELIYRAKGVNAEQARAIASQIIRGDRRHALDALAREELGIDPSELGGSAWVASGTSFGMFAAGAIVPLIPFAFLSGAAGVAASAALSALALFSVGAAITIITGQPALRSGIRQLAIGVAAAAITYGVGHLLGAAIS